MSYIRRRGIKAIKPYKVFEAEPRYFQARDVEKSNEAGFNVGRKSIYLPYFVCTFLRTPHLPPTFAKFKVPLNLNKFDMRDYLFHAYGVRSVGVRSYIRQSKLRFGKPDQLDVEPKGWFRPMSTKYMFVELEQPFVWPEEPKDYTEFDKEAWEASHDHQTKRDRGSISDPTMDRPQGIATLRAQAKALLEGKETWSPTRAVTRDTVGSKLPQKMGKKPLPGRSEEGGVEEGERRERRRGRGGLNKSKTAQVGA